MKLFVDLLPGWPEAGVRALARTGALPVVGARPRGLTAPIAWRGGPADPRPGDVVLRRLPVDGGVPDDLDAWAEGARSAGLDPWAIVHHPAQVRAADRAGAGRWLRGHEAGGRVPPTTALILLRAAHGGGPFVVEGLGPRGAAAARTLGAAGVVIGPATWLVGDSPLHPTHREHLAAVGGGRDTTVLGYALDCPIRVLGRGPSPGRQALQQAARRGDREALVAAWRRGATSWWERPEAPLPAPQHAAAASRHAGARDAAAAVRGVLDAIEAHRADVRRGTPLGGDPLGAGTPVVQGPMANVAERPGLARAVRAAGAMPFAALGALDPEQARQVATRIAEAIDRPWGLGVIGFEVMPHRDAHLALARELSPDAVILAGGSPELALDLQGEGLAPWLHTPSPALVRRALARGVQAVVLEGHEAGGHVGALTSAGLWEEGLAAAEEAEGEPLVVLAGGIGDAPSAAFAAAMAATAWHRGVRVALQAGTAFFFTREIATTGQITPAYQHAALGARATELVGSTVNLPLRCAPNPYVREARDLERQWLGEGLSAGERRERMERHNLGRARIAAKGIEHNPSWGEPGAPRYRPVPEGDQGHRGAFTMGQGATVTDGVGTVAGVVEALTAGARALLEAAPDPWGPAVPVAGAPDPTVAPAEGPVSLGARPASAAPVAVVGLGCVLPGGLDPAALWSTLVRAESAIVDVPPERWSIDRYWDPEAGSTGPARTYSRLAGLVRGFEFDPLRYRIPPRAVATLDPSQRMALAAAEQAAREAGWLEGGVDGERAAVVLGNAMGGEFAKSLALRVRFREVLEVLADEGLLAGDREAVAARVEERLAARLPPVEPDTMAGLLSNVIAGRVASWLDWMGGNLTVDAACAASLAAVAVAVDWLRNGRCDVVLTGGVDTDLSPETYVGFSRTHALSTGTSRPFSEHADGFVMGEGSGVLALKRLDDALADGDPVWAVIRGVGQSSDGRSRGITAPRDAGQRLAIDRAYAEAGFDATSVGMVEAHGTGTALGDRTEVGVLSEVFAGAAAPTWLGSAKSNLGHLKGAAGAAGLLKACLALATGVVPPTIHAGPVRAELDLPGGPLRLPRHPTPFPDRGGPRRACVSAFGFGGTNFHLLLEQAPEEAAAPAAVPELVAAARPHLQQAPERAAWPMQGARAPARTTSRGESAPGAVLWMFPGQGAQQPGAVASLLGHPAARRALAPLEEALPGLAADLGLSARTWADLEVPEPDTRRLHLLLYALGVGWAAVLDAAGVPVAATLGHSLGEYAALVAAGRLAPLDGLRLVAARGEALHACPPGAMLAVALDEQGARRAARRHDLALASVNGPTACVLSGAVEAVTRARADLGERGVRCTELAVDRAFHSPLVAGARPALEAALADVSFAPGRVPCLSAATATSFGAAPGPDLSAALVRPVRFAAALEAADPDLAIEVGPGCTLCGLARAPAIPVDPGADPAGWRRARAALAAAGHGVPGDTHPAPAATPSAVPSPPEAPGTEPAPPLAPDADQRWLDRAAAVQDLRIAALADPAREPAWRAARAALLADLAEADARRAQGAGTPPQSTVSPERTASPERSVSAPPPPSQRPAEAPSAAAAPTARGHTTEPPAVDHGGAGDDVRAAVIAAICESTGYPEGFLEDDADLDADLGIDSIRKMEILGLLQERLGFTAAEADYADLAEVDLAGLVAYVRERLEGEQASPAPQPAPPASARAWRPVAVPLPELPPDDRPLPPPGSWQVDEGLLLWRPPAPDDRPVPARAAALVDDALGRIDPAGVEGIAVVIPEGDPAARAAAGFARSLGREWQVPVRVIRHGPGADPARVAAEARAAGRPATVLLDPAPRALGPAPVPLAPPDLPASPVILATGGARGIVAACLAGLADLDPTVVLVGRSPLAPGAEPLERLREGGLRVTYRRCDLLDAGAVHELVAGVRDRHGRIDVVVHGAGVLVDAPAERLAVASAREVLAPKLDGARHLFDATAAHPPALWVAFSSLVAHEGNPGQTAYGAANAVLEAWPHPTAARSLALAWTAWSQVGMAARPGLLRLLEARGIPPLDPAAGAAAFREALGLEGTVALTAHDLEGPPLPWPLARVEALEPGHSGRFTLELAPDQPALADHRVGGRPLVPAALWVGALLAAARCVHPGSASWALDGFAVHAPTFVQAPRTARLEVEGGRARVRVDQTTVAEATLHPADVPESRSPPAPLGAGRPAEALYRSDLLFHGATWRVLDRIEPGSNGDLRADVRAARADPMAAAVDAAHQMLSAWAGRATGFMGLPVGAVRWVVTGPPAQGPLRVETHARLADEGVEGEVVAVDGTGRIVLRGETVRLRRAARWPADAPSTLEPDGGDDA